MIHVTSMSVQTRTTAESLVFGTPASERSFLSAVVEVDELTVHATKYPGEVEWVADSVWKGCFPIYANGEGSRCTLLRNPNPEVCRMLDATLNEVRVSNTIISAIEAKNATYQAALQAEQELAKKEFEAKQKVATAKGDADSPQEAARGEATAIKLKAEADAEAIKVKAAAQAEANLTIAKSLTPELIKWQSLLQWDGKLPQVSGGAVPFISLPKPE